jgi:hypothetical protein
MAKKTSTTKKAAAPKTAAKKKTATKAKAKTDVKSKEDESEVKAAISTETVTGGEKKKVEEIQDENLDEFEESVAKLDSIEKLEKLREIETRDDHRKGAYKIIDARIAEIRAEKAEEVGKEIGKEFEKIGEVLAEGLEESKNVVPKINEIRERLSGVSQKCDCHFRIDSNSKNSLVMAKAWLGVLAGAHGENNPYDVEVKTASDIPAEAQRKDGSHFKMELQQFGLMNVLDAVLAVREELAEIISDIESIPAINVKALAAKNNAFTHAQEARFHMGLTLASLKR